MQFLAIMKVDAGVPWERIQSFNVEETRKSWDMTRADVMRALWFIPGDKRPLGTVALLECATHQEAEARCRELPFIINNVASLDVIALTPCTAYEMLFESRYRG